MLHAEEDADHIDVEHPANTLQRILMNRLDVALDAGVVVEGVDGAELVDRGADIFGDVALQGHIGCDRERVGGGWQLLDGGLEIGPLAVDCDNPRTTLGEQLDGRGSDNAGRTGDDGNPAVQANSIGHSRVSSGFLRLFRIFTISAAGYRHRTLTAVTY